ncbi:hypothetical protein HB943_03790 [Listeria weihenstephanensis]|uniref:DUF5050 domain-containing protein n=1 Tax=Listeria weihenstephanensis TaxID=1006155 RepID=A0A841Z338_9LIST|nr:hypothetical protein [Listeria weihenstephanensis]MBC1499714.1 hypothetical protein [Listeria weihenstephanensis]
MDKETKRVVTVMMILLAIGVGFAISKIVKANKELSVEVKTEADRTRYIGANGMSFYSMVDTPNAIYTLIDTEGDTDAYKIAKAVYAIDKQTGKMEMVPGSRKMKYGYDGIDSTFGNEHYLGWIEADTDYTTRTVIYDIEQEKIIKKLNDSDTQSFFGAKVVDHTLYWMESDPRLADDSPSIMKSYNLKTSTEKEIDKINTGGTVFAFSDKKMWYKNEGMLKTYDLISGKHEIYNLGVDFNDLKPANDHLVAYFKYQNESMEYLYLYDTNLRKSVLLSDKDPDMKATFNGKGRIVSDFISYNITEIDSVKYDKTIQKEYPDNARFSTDEQIDSLLFITDLGEHEEIILMDDEALGW